MDGTGRLFEPLVPFLLPSFDVRVLSYPLEALSYDEILESLGTPPPRTTLLAESFGGPLALRLAARAEVSAVVLVATFVTAPRVLPPSWLARTAHPPPRLAIRHAMLERASPDALVELVSDAVRSVPKRTIAGRLDALRALDVRPELSRAGSVRWVVAARDRLVPPRATEIARRVRPDLAIETIDGPHLLAQSRPAEVARLSGR